MSHWEGLPFQAHLGLKLLHIYVFCCLQITGGHWDLIYMDIFFDKVHLIVWCLNID